MSLLRSLEDKCHPSYKHFAPLALTTVQHHWKHRLGIKHTPHFSTFRSLLQMRIDLRRIPVAVGRVYQAIRLLAVGHLRLGRIPHQLLTW